MDFDGIIFADTLDELNDLRHSWRVAHLLCERGGMVFTFHDTRYNITAGDYVIMPNAAMGGDFSVSPDFQGLMMSLSDSFVQSIAMRSNYGVAGHLSLLRNPVMRLSEHDFTICRDAMRNIRQRLSDTSHLFRTELMGSLLTAHILDLYDIHARTSVLPQISERTASLLTQFMELLYNGEYVHHRDLGHYASQLCITPHYLSEICKKVSGEPPSYWIDHFTTQEIIRLLHDRELSLTDIADRMNFSSVSYFSRYVRQRLNMSPSEYRK